MTTKQKIGTTIIIAFLIVGWGIAGHYDFEYQKQNDAWEEENLPPQQTPPFGDESVYKVYDSRTQEVVAKQYGIASFYDYTFESEVGENGFFTGKEIAVPCTPSMEIYKRNECFTKDKMFAASRKFERGSVLRVDNLDNGAFIYVIVTDIITHPKRILDLTSFAFSKLAPLELGLIEVEIELIGNISTAPIVEP